MWKRRVMLTERHMNACMTLEPKSFAETCWELTVLGHICILVFCHFRILLVGSRRDKGRPSYSIGAVGSVPVLHKSMLSRSDDTEFRARGSDVAPA